MFGAPCCGGLLSSIFTMSYPRDKGRIRWGLRFVDIGVSVWRSLSYQYRSRFADVFVCLDHYVHVDVAFLIYLSTHLLTNRLLLGNLLELLGEKVNSEYTTECDRGVLTHPNTLRGESKLHLK